MSLTLKTDFVNDPNLDNALSPTYTVTRASTKTFTDWEGVVRPVAANQYAVEGARLVVNGFPNSKSLIGGGWGSQNCTPTANSIVAPDGTTTGTLLTDDTSAGNHRVNENGATLENEQITSVYAKAGTVDFLAIYQTTGNDGRFFDLTNGTLGSTFIGAPADSGIEPASVTYPDAPAGWYRCWIRNTFKPSMTYFYMCNADNGNGYTGDGTGTLYLWGAQVENAAGMADKSPSELQITGSSAAYTWYATKKNGDALDTPITGVSIEEARTNLALHSQDTSNAAWVASNVTKGSTSVATPTGATSTTVRLTSSAANGTLLQTVTAGASQYAYSVYMKRVTGTGNIDLTVDNGTTWTTKTLTSSWQRFDVYDASETNPVIGVRIVTSGDAIDFWGSQLEAKANPSTYTGVTTSSSVTRNADLPVTTDMSFLDTAATAQGTFYIKASFPYAGTAARRILTLDDGTTTDRIYFELDAADNVNFATVHSADTDGASDGAAVITAGATLQAAARYADDDVHAYVNGTSSGQDTTAALPLADNPTTLRLGADSAGVVDAIHIQQVRYYNTALTDDEVEAMSNGTFPSTNAKALVRNAAQNLSRNLVINIGS